MELERDPVHVAIDGPAGSGKSTVAARLAARLGLVHVDTGAMYRTLTLVARREGLDPDDGASLAARLDGLDLELRSQEIFLDGAPVGDEIRAPEISALVSRVSAHAQVRAAMVRRQRRLSWACAEGTVMEGRDIGSVVLPLARCKIHLLAAGPERARRRAMQMGWGDDEETLQRVQRELQERDELDSSREHSPLLVSPDAHVVDTTALRLEQVVEHCAELVQRSRRVRANEDVLRPYLARHLHYRIVQGTLAWLLRGLGWLRVHGRGNEQESSSFIYACNHISWVDPPVLGAAVSREVHYLAKRELFWGPLGWLISRFNAIPIVRATYDQKAFDRAKGILAQGGSLVIFPEGTRKPVGRPGPIKRGLGILAAATGCPFVPCYIRNTNRLGDVLRGRCAFEVWLGPPIHLHALGHLRAELSETEIQVRIGRLFLEQIRCFEDRATSVALG